MSTLNYLSPDDLAGAVDPEWLLAAADDDRDGVADEAVVAQALEDAEAEIDAHLAARYVTPLQPAEPGEGEEESVPPLPAVIRQAGVALAAEALALRLPGVELGEGLAARVRQARSLLASIARGELALPGRAARKRANSTALGRENRVRSGAEAF